MGIPEGLDTGWPQNAQKRFPSESGLEQLGQAGATGTRRAYHVPSRTPGAPAGGRQECFPEPTG